MRRWRKLGARLRGRIRISAERVARSAQHLRRWLQRRRRALLVGGLVLLLALAGVLGTRAWWRRPFLLADRARILAQDGQLEAAAQLLGQAQALRPDEPRFAIERASVLGALSRWGEAETALRDAMGRVSGDLGMQAALGGVLYAQGRVGEVVTLLAPSAARLEAHGDSSFACQALGTLGLAEAARGDLLSAEGHLRRAAAARSVFGALPPWPLRERALLGLIDVLQLQQRRSEAEAVIRQSLSQGRESAGLGLALARILSESGRGDEAVAVLAGVVDRAAGPLKLEAAWAQAEILLRLGRAEHARAVGNRLPSPQSEILAAAVEGQMCLFLGDPAAARVHFARLSELMPGSARPMLMEARAAARAGQIAEARGLMEAALVREPGNREADRGLLELEERAGDIAAVRSRAERLLEDPVLRALGVRTLFALHARDDDARGGLLQLERLQNRYPADLSVRAYAAVFRILAGEVERGVSDLTALSGREGLPSALALLASAREGTSDALEAIELLAALAEREEAFAPARLVLAGVYQRLGRLDLAVREVDVALQREPGRRDARLARAGLALQLEDVPRALSELEALRAGGATPGELLPLLDTLADRLLGDSRDPRAEEVELAGRLLEQVLALAPERAQAHARLARVRMLQGKDEEALTCFARARALAPGLPAAWGSVAVAYRRGDRAGVCAELRAALAHTFDPRFGASLAAGLALTGDFVGAQAALGPWLEVAGSAPEGPLIQVLLLALRGESALAREACARTRLPREVQDAALSVHPGEGRVEEVLELFGLWSLGLSIEARERSGRLARDHGRDPLLLWWALRPLRSGGASQQRALIAERLARVAPSTPEAGLEVADAYALLGEAARERAALEALREAFPEEPLVATRLGQLLERSGLASEAAREYARAVRANDPPLIALNNLACLLANDPERREEALSLAYLARNRAPDRGETWDTLGWVLFLSGRVEESEALLSWAATLRPARPAIRYHLARVLAARGNRARALNHLRIARLLERPFAEERAAWALEEELRAQVGPR